MAHHKTRNENPDVDSRKHNRIVIYDPDKKWFKEAHAIIKRHENTLYPDERRVVAFLCLCIKYGDACMQTIVRERFASQKRNLSISEKKAQALKDFEDSQNEQ